MQILNLSSLHQTAFLQFCDKYIGKNYFNTTNFNEQIELSKYKNLNSSFIAIKENEIIAIRLTYAPGLWVNHIKHQYLTQLNIPLNKVGYFKSLFVHPNYQGQKLGPRLSSQSLNVLKQMGCDYILTHSWLESPNNSSVKYLENYGFKQIGLIPNFWHGVDYLCSGCKKQTCACTAVEMLFNIY